MDFLQTVRHPSSLINDVPDWRLLHGIEVSIHLPGNTRDLLPVIFYSTSSKQVHQEINEDLSHIFCSFGLNEIYNHKGNMILVRLYIFRQIIPVHTNFICEI